MSGTDGGLRKRVRVYGNRRKSRRLNFFAHRAADKLIAAVMAAVALGYVGATAVTWFIASSGYAGVPLGGDWESVQYSLGKPDLVRSVDGAPWRPAGNSFAFTQWLYKDPFVRVRFDEASRRAVSIYCENGESAELSCPGVIGVAPGDTEQQVLEKLGTPTSERIFSGRKVMAYPDIGYEVVLERLKVRGFRAFPRSGGAWAELRRYLLWLLP